MNNPWLNISLEDYEKHMSLSSIAQAQYLSSFFQISLTLYHPKSVAILGCAGGNGLEKINPEITQRVVCVDINPAFVRTAEERYNSVTGNTEFLCGDISSGEIIFSSVELIFASLLFEYVDIDSALENIGKLICKDGKLAVVLQVPNPDIPEVSPSPYKSLEILSEVFSFVTPEKFIGACESKGFNLILRNKTKLNSGKEFIELILIKT
ncbi:MAG: class I SAM-dependent methyltransferase [Ignavibacteriaceae bacterium]